MLFMRSSPLVLTIPTHPSTEVSADFLSDAVTKGVAVKLPSEHRRFDTEIRACTECGLVNRHLSEPFRLKELYVEEVQES